MASSAPPINSLLSTAFGSISSVLTTISTVCVGMYSLLLVYRRTFHPLSSYPGPPLAAISHIPWWWSNVTGNAPFWLLDLHNKYGPVVRFGPDDVSYIDAGDVKPGGVWHAIQGQEKHRPEFPKAPELLPLAPNGVEPITFANFELHRRNRRTLAPGFSERFLRDKEPLFQRVTDLLVETLRELGPQGPVEMTQYFNFTTYDIMGELSYSEDLGMLKAREYIHEVIVPFHYLKAIPVLQMLQYYPWVGKLWKMLQPPQAIEMRRQSFQAGIDRVNRRREAGTDLSDMWNNVMLAEPENGMSLQEQYANAEIFLIIGGETSASQLCGLMYYLSTNPKAMARLVAEVRGAFSHHDEIDLQRVLALPYLDACIQEGLRLYPPVSTGVPRCVTEEHAPCTVLGRPVPVGARMMVSHYATYQHKKNFADPQEYAPQRWLSVENGGEERFSNDRLGAVQPFSVGPRNCIGQNMARHEIRLILAKLIYNFDISLPEESLNWLPQRSWGIWSKPNLMVNFKPVER